MTARRILGTFACLLWLALAQAACGRSGGTSEKPGSDGGSAGGPDGRAATDGALDGPTFFADAGGGDGGVLAMGQLSFKPASATLTVTGSGPVTASFTLELTSPSGQTTAVTPVSVDFDRPDLATVTLGNPIVATAPSSMTLAGGTGEIQAVYGGLSATASLTVVVQETAYGMGLGPTSPGVAALGMSNLAADPAAGITPLLYPYDGTVFPLGLTSPPVMWNAPQAGDVYRMHYSEKNYSFDGYYTLAQLPGNLRLDQGAWDRITASNDAANSTDPLSFTLYRWDHVANKAYKTDSETWTVAPQSLRGAIYYWTTSNGGSLSRIPAGAGAVPQALTGPNGNNCMGCHAVSADGSTLVAGVRGENSSDNSDDRAWTSFNLPSGSVREVSTLFSGNLAITPDGKYVVSGDETLKLSDSTTGMEIANSGLSSITLAPTMTGLTTPAFAPSGALMAAIENGGNDWQYWDYTLSPDSELALLTFNEGTTTFGTTPTVIALGSQFPAGQQTINYPTFSPDSQYVAYQVADHASGCWVYPDGCQTTTTEAGSIYLQGAKAGATPIRLAQLSDPPAVADHDLSLEPTFNPIPRGGYFWVVFTSERAWGNDADVSGPANNNKKRLWVSAIDATIGTMDPSHPALFLEGQDTTTQNMRGFWTLSQCAASAPTGGVQWRQFQPRVSGVDAGPDASASPQPDAGGDASTACMNGFDCCSGFCDKGECVAVNQVSCAAVGGTCQTASDCCNPSVVQCTSGTCGVQVQ